jgi:hypothetical protein
MADKGDGGPDPPVHRRRLRWRWPYLSLIAGVLVVAIVFAGWLRTGAGAHPHGAGAEATPPSPAPDDQHLASAPGSRTPVPASLSPSRTPSRTPAPHPAGPTRHYIANLDGHRDAVAALGYNLFDTGSDPGSVDALDDGQRALVWMGSLDNADCATPGYSWAQFTAAVDALAGNPKVFGYFLADEPHPKDCPTAVADIRQRADYIHTHDPSHVSFIVVLDGSNQCGGGYGCEFTALRPAQTHVDLIGLDPYPCNVDNAAQACAYKKIDDAVHRAVASGIPISAVVPVFQAFGQACRTGSAPYYRLPSAAELRTMLAHCAALVPRPVFDYTYTWGRQGSACPTLSDADGSNGQPDLQSVLREHNAR